MLYKNGVGYFEHAGTVNGNQRVTVDFTSSQLNDVLQSLTALDSKGGIIGAVGYNSTMPIQQQLNTLALGLKDMPATLDVYQALRGQRVEVTGSGAPLSGRLVNVEYRKETDKNGETSEDHYFLIVETDAGALRTAELTDAVSVRMIDPALQKQFASYLEIIASAHDQQLRHLTLEDRGQGERQLQVSYISEVPVWKSTYRIVFPRDPNGNATLQGWAVVDNTVGVDWDNVQLSLVAGAPQSFIQPLSQPLYTQRPTIPIATVAQNAPITHEAAEYRQRIANGYVGGQLPAPAVPSAANSGPMQMAMRSANAPSEGIVRAGANVSGWLRRRTRLRLRQWLRRRRLPRLGCDAAGRRLYQRFRRLLRVRADPAGHDPQKRIGHGAHPAAGAAGEPRHAVERQRTPRRCAPSGSKTPRSSRSIPAASRSSRAASLPAKACSIPFIPEKSACSPTPLIRP